MYWHNNSECGDEIASTRSSTPSILPQPDTSYWANNPDWEENVSICTSTPPAPIDMYRSTNAAEATVSIGCAVPPRRSADRLNSYNSYWTPQCQMAKDVFHSVINVRKSWKTLPGGEAVWPPALEAALIEGKSLLL
ncbi:hypothetical protein C8R45DRAFT_1104440 [Mycena sanguinolenta]|nr:hypothetical protein C8R45DRAFT_1104440 [Mycena sanguinolenta]